MFEISKSLNNNCYTKSLLNIGSSRIVCVLYVGFGKSPTHKIYILTSLSVLYFICVLFSYLCFIYEKRINELN